MKNTQKGFAIPLIIALVAIIAIGSGVYIYNQNNTEAPTFTNPPIENNNMIRVNSPIKNAVVSSPLIITGEARGTWFFEGDFPVKIEDANGNVLGQHYAVTTEEWMTTEYIPFTSELFFENPNTETGTLILSKDNPSDFRELDEEIRINVRFDINEEKELMDLILYIQDPDYVLTTSCSETKKLCARFLKLQR